MSDLPSTAAAEQNRLELSVAAAAAERSNRPRHFVVISIICLIAASVALIMAVSARATAASRVAEQRTLTAALDDVINNITTLNDSIASRGTDPDPRVGQKIEALATAADLKLVGGVSDSENTSLAQTGLVQRQYTAKAANQDPLAILNFITSTQTSDQTPGLEIFRLSLRPGAPTDAGTVGWNADMVFTRWERRK